MMQRWQLGQDTSCIAAPLASVGVNRIRGVLHRGQTSEASGRSAMSLIRAASSAEYVVGVSRVDMESHLLRAELLPQSNELDRLRLMAEGRVASGNMA